MPSAPTSSAQAGAVNAPDIRNAENVLKDTLSSFSNQIPECYTLFRQGGLYLDQEKELKESWDSDYEVWKLSQSNIPCSEFYAELRRH